MWIELDSTSPFQLHLSRTNFPAFELAFNATCFDKSSSAVANLRLFVHYPRKHFKTTHYAFPKDQKDRPVANGGGEMDGASED